jgi:phosphoserine aminotransferase
MIHFTPGPSHISDQMKSFIREAVDLEIPSVSHRSSRFSEFSKSARDGLEQYLQVPQGYKIFYTYSATESMEIIIRSTVKKYSHHFVNGAFSKRFYDTAVDLGKTPSIETLEVGEANFSTMVPQDTELICVTCTETSTGAMMYDGFLHTLREQYKDKLIAVDITSSGG